MHVSRTSATTLSDSLFFLLLFFPFLITIGGLIANRDMEVEPREDPRLPRRSTSDVPTERFEAATRGHYATEQYTRRTLIKRRRVALNGRRAIDQSTHIGVRVATTCTVTVAIGRSLPTFLPSRLAFAIASKCRTRYSLLHTRPGGARRAVRAHYPS